MDANAPEVSKAMLHEVVESYPNGSASVRICVALTFSSFIHGKRLKVDEFADAIKPRLRGLGEQFHGTGVGAARALTAQQLCELVLCRTTRQPQQRSRTPTSPAARCRCAGLMLDPRAPTRSGTPTRMTKRSRSRGQ